MYGEVLAQAVIRGLRSVNAKQGERYYDLGAGAGKTVAVAWLMGLRATGVELIESRFKHACAALERLPVAGRPAAVSSELSFVHGSFLDIDFCDADIIFIDSIMFSNQLMSNLADRAACLRKGARVIFVGNKAFTKSQGVTRAIEYSSPRTVSNISATWGQTLFTIQFKLSEAGTAGPSKWGVHAPSASSSCRMD